MQYTSRPLPWPSHKWVSAALCDNVGNNQQQVLQVLLSYQDQELFVV